jgi:hypothetical protein
MLGFHCWGKIHKLNHLKGRQIYFGSWFQSMHGLLAILFWICDSIMVEVCGRGSKERDRKGPVSESLSSPPPVILHPSSRPHLLKVLLSLNSTIGLPILGLWRILPNNNKYLLGVFPCKNTKHSYTIGHHMNGHYKCSRVPLRDPSFAVIHSASMSILYTCYFASQNYLLHKGKFSEVEI